MNGKQALAAGLLEKYSPVLRYHDQEPLRADSPAILTDAAVDGQCTQLLDGSGKLLAAAKPLAGVALLNLDFLNAKVYATPQGETARPTDHLVPASSDWQADAAAMRKRANYSDVVYGRAVQQTPTARTWLQYWFFYYFNDKGFRDLGDHEGDWEMIQVGLDDQGHPELATFSQHKGGEKRDAWRKVESSDGGRPVVYVALGSHACYYKPGEYFLRLPPVFDHAMAGPSATPRVARIDETMGWVMWPGHWGHSGDDGSESPTGPGSHEKQWCRPDDFHKDAAGERRWHVGSVFFAVGDVVEAPARLTARRVRDRVQVGYEFAALDPQRPDVPIRLLVSLRRLRSKEPPWTESFVIAAAKGTVELGATLGRGSYEVQATAYSARNKASATRSTRVTDAPRGRTRAARARPSAPRGMRRRDVLRFLVSAPRGGAQAASKLNKTVADVLGIDATGAPWRVTPMFPTSGGKRPSTLARHFTVDGAILSSGRAPESAVAFDLARELAAATGFDVHPDLPSSAYAAPLPPEASGVRRESDRPPVDWARKAIRCQQAWDLSPGRGEGVVIAHPDTGFTDHPELEQGALDLTRDWDILSEDEDAHDPVRRYLPFLLQSPGHGTGTGSVIVGRPDGNLVGVATRAELVPIRTVRSVVQVFDGDVAVAVNYARRIGAHVISMSMGGIGFAPALQDALDAAVAEGIIVLAAAGNYWPLVVAPARLPNCLAIAATNVADEPWRDSASGPEVDLSAPGEDVWVAVARREHGTLEYTQDAHSGTSFAVAHTAGAAALWLQRHGRRALIARYGKSGLHPAFRMVATQTARKPPGWNSQRYGAGILDAEKLLSQPLPDRREVDAPSTRVAAARGRQSDSMRHILPELSAGERRNRLAALLGVPKTKLDERIGPLTGELTYLLTEHREIREALVQSPAAGRTAARRAEPVKGALLPLASAGLRRALR